MRCNQLTPGQKKQITLHILACIQGKGGQDLQTGTNDIIKVGVLANTDLISRKFMAPPFH